MIILLYIKYIKDIIENNDTEEYNNYFKNIIKIDKKFFYIYEKILIEELYKIIPEKRNEYNIKYLFTYLNPYRKEIYQLIYFDCIKKD